MSQMDLKPVIMEGFSIKPLLMSSSIKVELRGSADTEARASLNEFVTQAHAEAERLRVTEVIIDVHELYFINSVCLKSMVMWIDRVINMPADRRYTIRFLVDSHLHWQDRSILALQRMAPTSVQIMNWKGE